jgi:hypothetical protein
MSPIPTRRAATADDRRALAAWAASGAMAVTGRPGGPPLGPPDRLVPGLRRAATVIHDRSARLGRDIWLDPLPLLAERAAIAGLQRRGTRSCGGATRLLPTADRWVAASLARPTDLELLPAWLGIDAPAAGPGNRGAGTDADGGGDAQVGEEVWAAVGREVGRRRAEEVAERAWLLGLPVSVLPTEPPTPPRAARPLAPLPLEATAIPGPAPDPQPLPGLTVVDLTSLWAGPLCASLLGAAGARVVKVESSGRPDGSRRGPDAFFHLLNGGKQGVALDLAHDEGWAVLRELVARADIVIDGSRPRVLEQRGLDAAGVVGGGGPRVWVSITAHGRTGPGRDRLGFGDDAAVGGGLVVTDEDGPCFCADAVADPAAGLVAAAACLDALAVGGRWLLDVSLAGVSAHLAGPTLVAHPAGSGPAPDAPQARPVTARGPALGEHTHLVLSTLGVAL